jgi:hypothetical protein
MTGCRMLKLCWLSETTASKTSHNLGALKDNCLHLSHCCDIPNRIVNMICAGTSIFSMPNYSPTTLCCCILLSLCMQMWGWVWDCIADFEHSQQGDGQGGKPTCTWPPTLSNIWQDSGLSCIFTKHWHLILSSSPPFIDITLSPMLSAL